MILRVDSTGDWRAWLAANHGSQAEIWLVIQHKASPAPGPRYHEAIEQALCFGWIDSTTRKHDAHSFCQRFSPRRPRSNWSARNSDRAARMIEQGQMTAYGLAVMNQSATNT